ncbi:MAG: 2-hydroxychromene-2-carboxylate isomerase [Rhodoferax sp.]
MKHITFYLDFISPYAYLAFEELPLALSGLSYSVTYKPVALGGLLKHNAMLGPAEVPPKRDWVYRQVQWLAHARQLPLDMPARHPFNPLGLLRLAIATDVQGTPNRYVCESLMRHVWIGGADAADPQRLQELTQTLAPPRQGDDDAVKAQLRSHTEQAIAAGVFGVPAFVVDGKVFWGLVSLPMLRQYLEGDPWFDRFEWNSVAQIPSGLPAR